MLYFWFLNHTYSFDESVSKNSSIQGVVNKMILIYTYTPVNFFLSVLELHSKSKYESLIVCGVNKWMGFRCLSFAAEPMIYAVVVIQPVLCHFLVGIDWKIYLEYIFFYIINFLYATSSSFRLPHSISAVEFHLLLF